MRRDHKIKVIIAIIATLAIIIAIAFLVLFWGSAKRRTFQYVSNHREELEEFSETLLSQCKESNHADAVYNRIQANAWKKSQMVEFIVRRRGIVPGSIYSGFYYSPKDVPIGYNGVKVQWTGTDTGWTWREKDGDNWEHTERIMEKWFWFEMHF